MGTKKEKEKKYPKLKENPTNKKSDVNFMLRKKKVLNPLFFFLF